MLEKVVLLLIGGVITFCGLLLLKLLFKPKTYDSRLAECEKMGARFEEHTKNVDENMSRNYNTVQEVIRQLGAMDKTLATIKERVDNYVTPLLQKRE